MRKLILICAVSALVFNSCSKSGKSNKTISLSGAFALYPLAVKWAEEYKKENPDIEFDISAGGAGKGMTDALSGMVDIGMVSREISKDEQDKGAWFISVAIDAVIPVINSNNPIFKEISSKGLTKEQFGMIWDKKSKVSWKIILPSLSSDGAINVYTRSDACGAAQTWAGYFGKKQEDLSGTAVFGDPGLAEAVRKDILGVGYNNINFAYDKDTKKCVEGLAVIPIDINSNGKVDDDENFYNTRSELTKAIASGKFPSPPSRKLYFVHKDKPADMELQKFLKWVLNDGQKYVQESGYILLLESEMKENINKTGE